MAFSGQANYNSSILRTLFELIFFSISTTLASGYTTTPRQYCILSGPIAFAQLRNRTFQLYHEWNMQYRIEKKAISSISTENVCIRPQIMRQIKT